MESGDRVRMKTAISRSGQILASRSCLIIVRRRGVEHMDLEMRKKMEIIQFPENIDKLTGFFDKYLKSNAGENETIIGFISNSYAVIFKQKKNILSNFIE